jgi:ribosomal-protein-alanine N-acetyltransferase
MENLVEIHQATRPELSQIASFIASASVIHRHLDWRNTLEWLGSSPFLILSDSKEIQAILVAAPDPPGFAWIRCFAVGKNISPDSAWSLLSANAEITLSAENARMAAVGLQEWFSRLLVRHGFAIKQKIVVLEWNHHFIVPIESQQQIYTRPMENSDIPEVSEVDRLAFEPLWVNSQTSLQAAFLQSSHATVAVLNSKIIAYELSTSAQFNAHLARLAVLPEFRRQAIGRVLVNEMLTYYAQKGIFQVTVNTQNDNLASLHLYKSVGFRPTFEEYPVLFK